MKLCPECNSGVLPYAMVAVISAVLGFLTWLTLGLSEPSPLVRIGGGVAVFFAVGATLTHYVISCMRRHCRHQQRYARGPRPPASGSLGSTRA